MSVCKNLMITSLSDWTKVESYFNNSEWLGLDSEFMRERTYNAKLCLVQLSSQYCNVCLDPLAFDCSQILRQILSNPGQIKIIHSASQDIEVLGQYCKASLVNLYDTQLAAEFCGMPSQVGYANLVSHLLGVNLAKTQTRTDWYKRPLSKSQIQYSFDDIIFLKPMYDALNELMMDDQKMSWFTQELKLELARMNDYHVQPELAYLKFKSVHKLNPQSQYVVKELACWREKKAQDSDLPKSWIINDKAIYAIAELMPADIQNLKQIACISPRFNNANLAEILAIIQKNKSVVSKTIWHDRVQLSSSQKADIARLREKIVMLADHYSMPATRIATKNDIEQFVRYKSGRLAQGWRESLLRLN